jgi:hypothetical protein
MSLWGLLNHGNTDALAGALHPITQLRNPHAIWMTAMGQTRSERAYRWFCGLGLDGEAPDLSTFSKNRHGRFRDSDLLRRLFEIVLQRCIRSGTNGGMTNRAESVPRPRARADHGIDLGRGDRAI